MATISSEGFMRYWLRVLRPLSWWILLVLVLYAVHRHQQLMEQTRIWFSVSVAGQPILFDATAMLDGKPVENGERISLGSHTFTVSQNKAEPFQTKFFAWYGRHDFGAIKLKRSRGILSIQAKLTAPTVTITGPEFSTRLHDVGFTNFTVPTDEYAVRVEYAHSSDARTETVFANQTTVCVFETLLGSLNLSCNKAGATYELQFHDGQSLASGSLPATVVGLPARSYQITASYHKRQISKQVVMVEAEKTNDVPLIFALGAARIESVPSGADVRSEDGSYVGQTPLDLSDMTPQMTHFDLSLSGFEPVSLALEIVTDQTAVCRTNLVNTRYLEAIREARVRAKEANYNAVLRATAAALAAKPDDAEALALQTQASGHVNDERERVAQLERPRKVFADACLKNPDAGLFEEHSLQTGKPVQAVKATILKSLQASPMGFEILSDETPETDAHLIMARQSFTLGILGGSENVCLLVIGQMKPGETVIYYKVLSNQVHHVVEANGLFKITDNTQRTAMNSSRMQMTDILQSQVQAGEKDVAERISRALREVQ